MPKVIAVLQPKGGAGKTTLSYNLVDAMSRQGMDVVLVDSDPQGTARDWAAAREDDQETVRIYAIDRPELLSREVSRIKNDYVVIDGASKANKLAEAAVKAADLVLIPVQPSKLDVWASEDLVNMIKDRQEMLADVSRSLKAAFVLTRVIQGTNRAKNIQSEIEVFELPVIEGIVVQRVAYPESAGVGQSVFEYKPRDQAAVDEITLIMNNVLSLLEGTE
jgi:chromosome partitioning protein